MKQFKLLVVFAATLAFVACAEKKENKQTIEPRGAARGAPTGTTGTTSTQNQQTLQLQQRPAGIVESATGVDDTQFTMTVKNFLSASLKDTDVGTVSGSRYSTSTGVRVWVDLFRSNQVDQANAQLLIVIYDSIYASNPSAGTINVALGRGSLKQQSYSGSNLSLTFEDQYGRIILNGSIQANYFSGSVSFQNYTFWDGKSAPLSGTLGQFSIPMASMTMM